jgi:hypothetical protein
MTAKTKQNIGKAVVIGLPTVAVAWSLMQKGTKSEKGFMAVGLGILGLIVGTGVFVAMTPEVK